MNSEIEFKKCTVDDVSELIKVSQQFYPEHYKHIWKNEDPSFYINLSFNKKTFEEDFEIENIVYFLIKKKPGHWDY